MKALVKSRREPGIWIGDVPEPEVGPNDVLIRMRKTAICGTDIHIYKWDDWAQRTIPVPMQVGHEYCGEIVEIGSEVRGPHDRRSRLRRGPHHLRPLPQLPRRPPAPVPQHVGVGVNRPGCFAEYMVLPAVERVQAAGRRSPTRSPRSSIRSATRRTRRCRSTWSARTC